MSSTTSVIPTTIIGIKRLAKVVGRNKGISHTAALDMAARQAGFANFQHANRAVSDSGKPPKYQYTVTITTFWKDTSVWKTGRVDVKVPIPQPFGDIVRGFDWRRARGLGYMQRLGPDTIIRDDAYDNSKFGAINAACQAGRMLEFLAVTGLRPSKKRIQPNGIRIHDHCGLPGIDHSSRWYDPATKSHMLLDEPYGLSEEILMARQAWREKHGWRLVKPRWGGVYYPGHTSAYMLTEADSKFPLDRIVNLLENLGPPLTTENCEIEYLFDA